MDDVFWKRIHRFFVLGISAWMLFGWPACDTRPGYRDISGYYFPLDELDEGKVYAYRPVGHDTLPPFYWYYRTLSDSNTSYLTGMYYDHTFTPRQWIREERVQNGMLLQDLRLYATDSLGKQFPRPVQIAVGNVFPFEVKDSLGLWLYKISYREFPDTLTTTTLIKNRRYIGKSSYTFQGRTYPCVRFKTLEAIENDREGTLEVTYPGEELYAEGLGLVYYRKEIKPGWVLAYELFEIFNMPELENRFQEQIQLENR